IEEIADLFADHPGGLAVRYVQEGRLLIGEVARCLVEHDERGAEAREILAETEGKRAEKPAHKPAQAHKGNGPARPQVDPEPAPGPDPESDAAAKPEQATDQAQDEIPSLEAMREELLELGFFEEEIAKWTPDAMWRRIRQYREPDDFPADDGGDWD